MVYLFELNFHRKLALYIDRWNYWRRWLRMAGKIQCELSLFGHLFTKYTWYPDKSLETFRNYNKTLSVRKKLSIVHEVLTSIEYTEQARAL
jgi:hypothetical protein